MTIELYLGQIINEEEGTVLVEMDGMSQPYETQQIINSVLNGDVVRYNEEDEKLVDLLKHTTIKYISVEVNADNSGEHDVYEHVAIIQDGEIKMNIEGNHIKTYKREIAAIKFAESLGYRVVIN